MRLHSDGYHRTTMVTNDQKISVPSESELSARLKEFEANEHRQRLYEIANQLVSAGFHTDDVDSITDGLCILLSGWHARYYMAAGGFPSAAAIESTIAEHYDTLTMFRDRPITELDTGDEPAIERLFRAFLQATKGPTDRTSSVAVAKALHLLAPAFFPLWDTEIANAVSEFSTTPYVRNSETKADAKWRHYLGFCKEQKAIVAEIELRDCDMLTRATNDGKSTLKLLDEYNYATFVIGNGEGNTT